MTFASPLLRQISSAMKRLQKVRSKHPITLQLIPEYHITSRGLGTSDYERLCLSLYHCVPQPVERTMSRRISDTGKETPGFFREPAFTLARPLKPAVQYSLGSPRTSDVLGRHTFLHVGYRFSAIFHDPYSSDHFQMHLPVQMQACWNGVAALDPATFYTPHTSASVWPDYSKMNVQHPSAVSYVMTTGRPDMVGYPWCLG